MGGLVSWWQKYISSCFSREHLISTLPNTINLLCGIKNLQEITQTAKTQGYGVKKKYKLHTVKMLLGLHEEIVMLKQQQGNFIFHSGGPGRQKQNCFYRFVCFNGNLTESKPVAAM